MEDLKHIQATFQKKLSSIDSREQLDALEIEFLGRKGEVNKLFKLMGETKDKEFGQKVNELKSNIDAAIKEKWLDLKPEKGPDIDTTLPGNRPTLGHLHPTTQTIREINAFFRYLGYSVYEGPEIEKNEFNFEKLNLRTSSIPNLSITKRSSPSPNAKPDHSSGSNLQLRKIFG